MPPPKGQTASEQQAKPLLRSFWQWGLPIGGLALLLCYWKPLLVTGLLLTAWALDDLGQTALQFWLGERILALEPQQVQARILLAEAHQQKGALAAAWEQWELALAQSETPSEQAWLHLQLGQLNLRQLPSAPSYGLTATGQVVVNGGSGGYSNTEARLRHLNQALALDPDLESAWFARGLLKARENADCQGARADLEKACALGHRPTYGPVTLEMCGGYTYPSRC